MKLEEYLNALTTVALRKVQTKCYEPLFDPQGRLLVEINLTDLQLTDDEVTSLNFTPTPKVTVSLDVECDTKLNQDFLEKIKNNNAYSQLTRNSIIPMQQELYFHLLGAKRVLAEGSPYKELYEGKNEELEQALKYALEQVNLICFQKINDYFAKLRDNEQPDIAELNKILDKARDEIATQGIYYFLNEVSKLTGVTLPEICPKSLKKIAVTKTATDNDLLHLDVKQGLATYIKGSPFTAHDRNSFAHRNISTLAYPFNSDNKPPPRIQIRTPSPGMRVKSEKTVGRDKENDSLIQDVVKKLQEIESTYRLNEIKSTNDKPKAYVYNRYTALYDRIDDLQGRNQQTQSSQMMMAGMHRFNRIKLNENPQGTMVFTQNISVNGFGRNLTYNGSTGLLRESTLMTELALLHTVYESLPTSSQREAFKVFNYYKAYLQTPSSEGYFAESEQGIKAIKTIQSIKEGLKNHKFDQESDSITENAARSLVRLFTHDKHMSHDYAKTIQALSVFCEPVSLSGCKSGNERTQAINGRVAVLDSLVVKQHNGLFQSEQLLLDSLSNLANSTDCEKQASLFNQQLSATYNKHGLYAASTLISNVDQFAGAKVKAKIAFSFKFLLHPGDLLQWIKSKFDRNYAEESTMNNLNQNKAGSMQAHKRFSERFAGYKQAMGEARETGDTTEDSDTTQSRPSSL